MRTHHSQDGITLLVTLLLMGVLLGVSASILGITLKQYQLAGVAYISEVAFQAANAGMECALYYDRPRTGPGIFEVPGNGSEQTTAPAMACMGQGSFTNDANGGTSSSGQEQHFRYTWGSAPAVCSDISVYKFYSTTAAVPLMVGGVNMRPSAPCPVGGVCTIIQSRGYNVACNQITTDTRVVERELTQIY